MTTAVYAIDTTTDLTSPSNNRNSQSQNVSLVPKEDDSFLCFSCGICAPYTLIKKILISLLMVFIVIGVIVLIYLGSSGLLTSSSSPVVGSLSISFKNTASKTNSLQFQLGKANATQIESLQYAIVSIALCADLETSGSSFNNPQNCWSIYTNNLNIDYNTFFHDQAAATESGFTDMMNPLDVKKLGANITFTADQLRTYRYAVINWLRPIKLKSSIQLADGSMMYTHDGTSVSIGSDMNGHPKFYTNATTSLLTGPAELAIGISNNGGSFTKLATEFTLTAGSWDLILAFNPDSIVKGAKDVYFSTTSNYYRIMDKSGSAGIDTPYIALNPIPFNSNQTVTKHTYMFNVTIPRNGSSNGGNYFFRHELYWVDTSLRGVDTCVTSINEESPSGIFQTFFTVINSDHTLSFQDWGHKTILKMLPLNTVGESGTATIYCHWGNDDSYVTPQCLHNPAQPSYTVLYHLAAITTVA